ncbi:Protein HAPLESS 2 [Glycine soja]|uniref:Protein HAPLESS 2 n=1 Tax=Glycine soja TaxID=3848 RepID=A0A445IYH2_GLYSO|nr:Protein HAPLESS 2 [Glycine soja]
MALRSAITLIIIFILSSFHVVGIQIISKSKLEKCEKNSNSEDNLNCTTKIVLNMAVPSGSSGGEASIVAELVEVEENSSRKMQTLRIPPVITVNKTSAYALYQLTYIRDVPYKPEEYYVKTRKCEPDAGANVVKICERQAILRDEEGHIIEYTQPICCPCGPQRRMPSSCGNFFDKLTKGKANTAHCVRFPGDWFHVFGIGRRTLGFSVRIQVKSGTKVSEVFVGPENRTVISDDKFLRVNLIGDFVGYTNIPSFEDFYLVVPRQGSPGQPQDLGRNISMWMLLERVRFTLDGIECNKIGVSYEAFNQQPNFCSSPFWTCLHNQLWNFREADLNRISRNQVPLYGLEGRFERINQHPSAGSYSFSIGITEVLSTNLVLELSANDVEYVYQRSPGKIISVSVPTFEALTQFGVATITTKNTGEVEASYSLTFNCSKDITLMEEQFLIMKPNEVTTQSCKIYPSTDQASKYFCAGKVEALDLYVIYSEDKEHINIYCVLFLGFLDEVVLKDSDYNEVDRAECQFATTATVLDNDTHKGLFDPLYDWWEDILGADEQIIMDKRRFKIDKGHHHIHDNKHHKQELRHSNYSAQNRRRTTYEHMHKHSERNSDYFDDLHHVHKEMHKYGHKKQNMDIVQHIVDHPAHHKHRKKRDSSKGELKR